MKVILQDGRRYVLRFDKDEDVVAGLEKFMADSQVAACSFNGVGAAASLELGYFNTHLKEYRRKPILDALEIISFTGNGATVAGKPTVHCHGIFSGTDFVTLGGHVFKLIVSVTCEIFLIKLDGELKRELNPDFNLNLLV
ncbi:MAG: DNA-binding protein [Candidatus Doudnabacteria bacterium]|nr:DNA-binding protein [Candidatus Doudnabacteria bacterium]